MCGLFPVLLIIMATCEAGTLVFWLCFHLSAPASKWEWWKAAGEHGEAVGESMRERKKNNRWIVESVRNKEVSRYWCVCVGGAGFDYSQLRLKYVQNGMCFFFPLSLCFWITKKKMKLKAVGECLLYISLCVCVAVYLLQLGFLWAKMCLKGKLAKKVIDVQA